MTIETDLQAAVTKAAAAAQILHDVANGPASGAGSTVATLAGAVSTVAKALADIEAAFAANSVLAEVDADRVAAEAAAVAAISAKVAAEAAAASLGTPLQAPQNLADLPDPAAARTAINVYSKSEADAAMAAAAPVAAPPHLFLFNNVR